ncbi:MAG: hypothetical protein ACRC7U_00900 [Moraxella sp.]
MVIQTPLQLGEGERALSVSEFSVVIPVYPHKTLPAAVKPLPPPNKMCANYTRIANN